MRAGGGITADSGRSVSYTHLNERFRVLGLQETKIFRFLFDTEAARQGKENLCQPKEIGSLLEEIYHGRCVSANASERMRAMLSQQQINHKIPNLLPPTVRVEHKTGEDEGITNDVGILYGREPCVLVFVSNETDVPAFEQVIRTVKMCIRDRLTNSAAVCVVKSSSNCNERVRVVMGIVLPMIDFHL